jgi:hypothetical protein
VPQALFNRYTPGNQSVSDLKRCRGGEIPLGRYDRQRMQVMRAVTRFWQLSARRRALLLEAAASLALASAGLRLLPFKRAIRLGSVPLRSAVTGKAEDVAWAIEAAARRVPWRAVCIHKGIAAQRMLRSRGLDATLHYGIGNDADRDALAAHVWVNIDGAPVIGGEEARAVAAVGAFP